MNAPSHLNKNHSTHEVAPIFSRIWAAVIDNCLVLGAISSATISDPVAAYSASANNLTITYLTYLIYFISFEALTGQTLGKRLLGIAVTAKGFAAFNFKLAFRRYSIDLLLILFTIVFAAGVGNLLIGIWLFINACAAMRSQLNMSQRDRLAGSVVINCNEGPYSYPTLQITTLLLISPVSIEL